MNEINVTMGMAAKVWWALMWRVLLAAVGSGIVAGIIVGIICHILGIKSTPFGALIGGGLGIYFHIFYIKKILNKKFKNFRVTVVSVD